MCKSYLNWVVKNTDTTWWHDSGDVDELERGLKHGASGVTTNPVLTVTALQSSGHCWRAELDDVLAQDLDPDERAVRLTGVMVRHAAGKLKHAYRRSHGEQGYVCAQVSTLRVGDRETMRAMARWYHEQAPNIAVKLPATVAGLDVAEECIAEGITTTLTLSFTVAQALAIGEMHQRGIERAQRNGVTPGHCFAVVMIGRLDDYLRDIAGDSQAVVTESDIRQSGLAIVKRAYGLYRERGYKAMLCVAALRGTYHMTELVGGRLIMSIHPKVQDILLAPAVPKENRIDCPIPEDTIERLSAVPDFMRAYEPDGLSPAQFLSYGATQCTLSQFTEMGWKQIGAFTSPS